MKKFKTLFSFILIFVLTIAGAIINFAPKTVKAESTVKLSLYSPINDYEYFSIGTPKCVYEDEFYYIFAHTYGANDANKDLVIYDKASKSYSILNSLTDPTQATVFYGETAYLIYQDNHLLKAYDLLKSQHADITYQDDSPITLNNFSYNGTHFLIASVGGPISISEISITENGVTLKKLKDYSAGNNPIVALNETDLYYSVGDEIYFISIENFISGDKQAEKIYDDDFTPTHLVASNDSLYALHANGVNRFIKNSGYILSPNKIENGTEDKLGVIQNANYIALYGNDLLICNATKTIQKFDRITLQYTGVSTATTQASNERIPYDSTQIDVYDKTVAVLSPSQISLFNNETNAFNKFAISSTGGYTPIMMSVGKNSVAISSANEIRFYSLENGTYTTAQSGNLIACDYRDGKYYFLSMNNSGEVYVYSENGALLSTITGLGGTYAHGALLTVDVDGYMSVYAGNEKKIYRFKVNELNQATLLDEYALELVSKELSTDLDGNIYSLSDGNEIEKITIKTGEVTKTTLTLDGNLSEIYTGITNQTVKSFALNYDNDEVYFILNGQSLVLKTTGLDNRSITNISGALSAVLNGENASLTGEKVCLTGKNVYRVEIGESDVFTYDYRTVASSEEYLILGSFDGYTLLLSDELYLAKNEDIANGESIIKASQKTKLFVSGGVNLYYYPVLSVDNRYSLKDNGETVRLSNGDELTVLGEATLNGNKFYYVSAMVDGVEKCGFAPENFLRDSLTQHEEHLNLKYLTVKTGGRLLSDDKMTCLYEFTKDTVVRTFGEENGYLKAELITADGVISGYIAVTDILKTEDSTVKNAVIILVITIALTATALYLIFKKKEYIVID